MEIQAMGQLLSRVASCHNCGRIGGKAKAFVLVKVMSKGDDKIIVQLSNAEFELALRISHFAKLFSSLKKMRSIYSVFFEKCEA